MSLETSVRNVGDAILDGFAEVNSGQGAHGTWPIDISGLAATAAKLATARNIAVDGDAIGSRAFDGSQNVTITLTLAAVLAGGLSINTATHGAALVYDTKGRLVSAGAPAPLSPSWANVQNKPTSLAEFGITDAAKSGANNDITSLSGLTTALSTAQGGTGFSSYTVGDLLFAINAGNLGRLAAGASGNVLLSNGAGAAPSYGKVGLDTHTTGVVPVTKGGTGSSTAGAARVALGLTIGTDVQAYSASLAAIANIAGSIGLLRKTGTSTWSVDTTTYAPLNTAANFASSVSVTSSGLMATADSGAAKMAVVADGSAGSNAAFIAFNRSGSHAVYFGLDVDNKLKVGGWSLGANAYEILHAGNFGNFGLVTSTGSVASAAKLTTARNINGVAFDGTQNITLTAASPFALTRGGYLTGSNYDGSAAQTWAVDATTAATASKIVARDAVGDIFGTSLRGTMSLVLNSASTANNAIELGSMTNASTPYMDFHSSGTGSDYDVRVIASGGGATAGQGELRIYATKTWMMNAADVGGNLTVQGDLTVGGNFAAAGLTAGSLGVQDTRAVASPPSFYYNAKARFDFKDHADVNNPPVHATQGYANILTIQGWVDPSGGVPTQVSFGQGIAVRQALDATTWGAWRTMWHDGNFTPADYARKDSYANFANDVEVQQALRLRTGLYVLNTAADGWTMVINRNGGSPVVSASRISAGYDSGVAGSVNASGWFRSSDNTGWYNQSYGGGIYMTDTIHVRVAGGKSFRVDSALCNFIPDAGDAIRTYNTTAQDGPLQFYVVHNGADVRVGNNRGRIMLEGSAITAANLHSDSWFYNEATNTGIYNAINGNHLHSRTQQYWAMTAGGSNAGGLELFQGHDTNKKGSFYWDADGVGLLNNTGAWGVRLNYGSGFTGGTLYGRWVTTGEHVGQMLSTSGNNPVGNTALWVNTPAAQSANIAEFLRGGTTVARIGPLGDYISVNSGTANQWYGRIGTINNASDRSIFIGTYTGNSILASHTASWSTWAPLYINTADGRTGGEVQMPAESYVNGSRAFQYVGWISSPGANANTVAPQTTSFTYSNNAPFTGPLVRFNNGGYDLELNAPYLGTGLAVRAYNADGGAWNNWSTIWHSNNFNPANYALRGDNVTFAKMSIDRIAVGYSGVDDIVNGAPWYGMGRTSTDLLGTGGTQVQVAGYAGLRLRSNNSFLDFGNDGVIRTNNTGIYINSDISSFGMLRLYGGSNSEVSINYRFANDPEINNAWTVGRYADKFFWYKDALQRMSLSNAGDLAVYGRLIVGSNNSGAGQDQSWIEMRDSNDGVRYVHCNGGNIGFVSNAGAWSFRVTDAGDGWFGYLNGWLSSYVNQDVRNGSGPTFTNAYNTAWWRTTGDGGWYSQTYDGGVHMIDTTYVRIYGGKNFYCANDILAGGNVTAASDERLKMNWRHITERRTLVDRLAAFEMYGLYDRVDIQGLTQIGVGAQSFAEQVMPEAVVQGADGHLGVNYGNAAMVAALELAKRVVAAENRAVEAELRADQLEARIRRLETMSGRIG